MKKEYDKDGENILKETNSTVLFCMLDELVGLFCRRRRRRVFGGSAPSCGSFTKEVGYPKLPDRQPSPTSLWPVFSHTNVTFLGSEAPKSSMVRHLHIVAHSVVDQ